MKIATRSLGVATALLLIAATVVQADVLPPREWCEAHPEFACKSAGPRPRPWQPQDKDTPQPQQRDDSQPPPQSR